MRTTFNTVEEWESGPYARVCEAAGSRSQIGVAEFLGIRQSSISDAKKRKALPPEWLLTVWEKTGISPEWIVTGQGYKYLAPTDENMRDLGRASGNETVPHCFSCPLNSKINELQNIMRTCTQIKGQMTRSKPGSSIVWYEDGKPISLYSQIQKADKDEED